MFRNSNRNNQLFSMNLSSPNQNLTLEPIKFETVNNVLPKKEMKWAGPTWLILHTLAEKVDEVGFKNIRVEFLNTIYTICTLLPCPLCASHAKKYMDGVNFNTINNKEDLKYLLFEFHNSVSKEKGLVLYNYDNMDLYKTANTMNVIQNFMIHFSRKSGNVRLLSDDLHRSRAIINLKAWFNDNIKYFAR